MWPRHVICDQQKSPTLFEKGEQMCGILYANVCRKRNKSGTIKNSINYWDILWLESKYVAVDNRNLFMAEVVVLHRRRNTPFLKKNR